ncbi:hypothetical protein [Actinoplanes sp. TFC3]|uniref:hypothetical protein n=1 Tax=Actinoplanes sp. TFC3 TaxID=1710355 RepID=UPI000B27C4B1|nr:hypothetical protein [Actinoplanes sp. TFC3]
MAILSGAVIGVAARILLPGRQRIGVILTVLIGMGAAVAGTWAADRWDLHSTEHFTLFQHEYDWLVVAVQAGTARTNLDSLWIPAGSFRVLTLSWLMSASSLLLGVGGVPGSRKLSRTLSSRRVML